MFTVFIAEKEHIDAIRQENRLFFEPFLDNKELAFCIWNPEGQTLRESVPGLFDAVGRRKDWRAVIVNNGDAEQLKKQNPFDVVDYSALNEIRKPSVQPAPEESWDEWEETWREYYRELTPVKEALCKKAMELPLQKLCTWLCFRPRDYILEDVSEKNDIEDWALERIGKNEIKPSVRMEIMERNQYRCEIKMKEKLHRSFTGGESINIAYPSEVHCVSERITENGFFHPATFWNVQSKNNYSGFAERNMYFDKMRFMVFDVLPKTHRDHRCDRIRFLYTVLIFASNPLPGSVMRARHLYLLESENDDAPLCTLVSSYDQKLSATYEIIENEIEKIRSEIPGALTDKEAEALFCTPADVAVALDKSCDTELLFVADEYGLSADCPNDENAVWNSGFISSKKSLEYIVKNQRRAVKKSIDKLPGLSEVSYENISRLNSFQLDDIRDYTNTAEDEMVESIPESLGELGKYSARMEEKGENVKKLIERRMSKKLTLVLSFVCIGLFVLCCLPMLGGNAGSTNALTTALVMILITAVLVAMMLFVTLFFLRRPLVKAVKSFNEEMEAILADVKHSMHQFSRCLSAVCNVRRGYTVLNCFEKDVDEYTKRLRIRKKHQEDIRMLRADLAEHYIDFIGGKEYLDEALIQPYEYDFSQKTEYEYPAPFVAGDACQLEFLESGNFVTAPTGFVSRISVRMEEVYDK